MNEFFIPFGVDPEKYKIAQEKMYGISERRDALMEVIKTADKKLEDAIDEARELLTEFPTLSLQSRKKL